VTRHLPEGPLLVDSSFVLGVLFGEPAATRFSGVLRRASIVDLVLGELFVEADQRVPIDAGDIHRVLQAQGLSIVSLGAAGADLFPMLKAMDLNQRVHQWAEGVPDHRIASLSTADMASLAVGLHHNLPVLTGNAYWQSLGLPMVISDYRDPELQPISVYEPVPSS
jgi:PIN domain nuclease of toxin-antitoxin system